MLTRAGITRLTQLEGKTLGYHTVLPVVLSEMLVKAGVDISKVRLVDDQTYDPLLLVHGNFDALQAYQSNEPITLRADHYPFRMWTPAQFGIPGTFNVQVVNRKFLAAHRTAVADFLRASFRAFSYCTVHAATCVGYLAAAQGPTFDVAHAEAEWKIESTLAIDHHLAGRGIGVQTLAEWAPEAKAVAQYKLVHKAGRRGHERGHLVGELAVPGHEAYLALGQGSSAAGGRRRRRPKPGPPRRARP